VTVAWPAPILPAALALVGIAGFAAAWQAATVLWEIPEYILPGVPAVIEATERDWRDLAAAAGITGYEALLSFALAVVLGISGALVLHLRPRFAQAVWPLVVFAKILPQVAIAPILIVWLGLGLLPKLIIAALLAFFPLLISAYVGLKGVDEEVIELARSMQASRSHRLLAFELPSALPHILSGAKIAMTSSVIGVIVAEFLSSNGGLGHLLLMATGALDAPLSIAVIVVLSLEGCALYLMVSLVERLAMPWHISQRRRGPQG
jgi:NitT/TauT family transport system permease protein